MTGDRATPLSILAGSIVIALGLYFGLRERPISSDRVNAAGSVASSNALAADSTTSTAASSSNANATAEPLAADAATNAEAKKAVERLRQVILAQCWTPHKNDKELPKQIHLIYSGGFDKLGVEIARGLSDTRETYYAPLSVCAHAQPMDLRIAPPGKNISVTLPMELP